MKKTMLTVLLTLLLSSCGPAQATTDPNLIYTQAVETVAAQLTGAAVLLPPTATETETPPPEPTGTATMTLAPTATPTEAWVNNPAGKATAPILLYTTIADNVDDDPYYQWESPLNVSSKQFEQEMMALKDLGYTSLTVSQLSQVIWEGGPLPPRPVAITFDSNKLGIYRKAFPIMQRLGFVGTIYVVVNQLNGSGVMTSQQVKDLIAAGWEVGSKGMTGNNLVDVLASNSDTLGDEISGSRLRLEETLGVPITSFSYPAGAIDGEGKITSRVQRWGYKNAVGLFKSSDHSLGSIYYMPRFEIRKDLALEDFMGILPWKGDRPLSPETVAIGTAQPVAASPNPAGSNGTATVSP
ncbi:MAG: polysaccharide deacetylase family protein [Anaerolineaceae bacterium]|nr:polysaccharide deacetylase family protein [Anaerolineaceae bacterium]